MHSSRMRTGRSLTVCCSLLPRGGGFCQVGGGSPWSGGVLLGPRGVSLFRGGSPCWGVLPGPGGCLPGPRRGGSPETPPVYRITDTCKNITLATTSLRPVIMIQQFVYQILNVWLLNCRFCNNLSRESGAQTKFNLTEFNVKQKRFPWMGI